MIFENDMFHAEDRTAARKQTWAMTLVCTPLALFAAAAATRIPEFLGTNDYVNVIGISLFIALVAFGLVANITMHIAFLMPETEAVPAQQIATESGSTDYLPQPRYLSEADSFFSPAIYHQYGL